MFAPLTVIGIICLYMGLLFALAYWAEQRVAITGETHTHPLIYALSINIYITASGFYGAVGLAVNHGPMFFASSTGAIIGIVFWWIILRRLVLLKEIYHITSIADLISTRYDRSQLVAALVTLVALVGSIPYIALQLKAVISTFGMITAQPSDKLDWTVTGSLVTLLMIVFTIMFGVRRLDPTERHQGVMTVLALECVVKLLAILSAAVFVIYMWFGGVGNFIDRITTEEQFNLLRFNENLEFAQLHWVSMAIMGMAVLFVLPRQFHVEVVENSNRRHILLAMIIVPLYIIIFRLSNAPIAAGGIAAGLPADQADTFTLLLPQMSGNLWLTLFVFIGGFAAATGMIIVTTMTLSTMATNHLILPVIERVKFLTPLRRKLLQCRWLMVALVISLGYGFAWNFSGSYLLSELTRMSMVAMVQFAPVMLGGLYWSKGNRKGALLGLSAGFLIWIYTLLIPAIVYGGWLPQSLLESGPLGISMLRPEALFGLTGLPKFTHCLIWSMLFNVVAYLFGSLYFNRSDTEKMLALEFINVRMVSEWLPNARPTGLDAHIPQKRKLLEAEQLLRMYLPHNKVQENLALIVEDLQIRNKTYLTILELVEFHRLVERTLAGSIGAASAHRAFLKAIKYKHREAQELKTVYNHILSELLKTPRELNKLKYANDHNEFESTGDHLEAKLLEREARIRQQESDIQRLQQEIERLKRKNYDPEQQAAQKKKDDQ